MAGCHDKLNAVTVVIFSCPVCGGEMEAFYRDGQHAVDAVCDVCGFRIPAGTPQKAGLGKSVNNVKDYK